MKLYLFSLFFFLLISTSFQQGVSYGGGSSTGYGGSGGSGGSSGSGSGYGGSSGSSGTGYGGSGGSNNNEETTTPEESGETITIPQETGETITTFPENGETGVVIQESGEAVSTIPENGETVTVISENGETGSIQESGETGIIVSESGETSEAGEGQEQPQTTTPVTVFPPSTLDTFIVDFHYLSGRGLNTSHPAFHYCFGLADGITQCDLYNGTDSNSRLLGVELVVGLDILQTFDVEERKLWYPHAFEVLNGFVVIPNLSPDQELEVMKVLVNTYAKTIAFYGNDPAVPIGAPQLAFGWQDDQQVNTTLARELDQFLNLTTTFEERAKAREGLVTDQLLEGLNSWMNDGESPQLQVFTISVDTDTNEPL